MRSYKMKSYLPEKTFFGRKDEQFWRAAFEDCFVIDVCNNANVIASYRNAKLPELSAADKASLLTLFDGEKDFLILPCPGGTLLVYPAWEHLGFALAFLLRERFDSVVEAYKNAQRYPVTILHATENKIVTDPKELLEVRLSTLDLYMAGLFGAERETNLAAQILMIANLVGCRLCATSIAPISVTLDEMELERLGAYLFCTFMTMRRYNGEVSAAPDTESLENAAFSTHVLQEYGLRIQQSLREGVTKYTTFDIPAEADVASFATHPAFKSYKIEETDGTFRLHIFLGQKVVLSSVPTYGAQKEITIVLFPFV